MLGVLFERRRFVSRMSPLILASPKAEPNGALILSLLRPHQRTTSVSFVFCFERTSPLPGLFFVLFLASGRDHSSLAVAAKISQIMRSTHAFLHIGALRPSLFSKENDHVVGTIAFWQRGRVTITLR